ncbi:MAG TPA: ankyrin repeat domain-containing protein [Vicinamibacterales bacterium]|nr:ankyrin repeat domain-containing protein [Vicinamibacterales bacterium]
MPRYALMFSLGLAALSGCGGGDAGITPLMRAARVGAIDEMKTLLDEGADPDARDFGNGWTALHHAIHKQQLEAVRLLLDRGVSPNRAVRGTTALMMAAMERDPAILELLLSRGARAEDRAFDGSTALTIAVSGGALMDIDRPLFGGCHPATVRALMTHDPALTLPESMRGREALFWARFHGCDDVLKMISCSAGLQACKDQPKQP